MLQYLCISQSFDMYKTMLLFYYATDGFFEYYAPSLILAGSPVVFNDVA